MIKSSLVLIIFLVISVGMILPEWQINFVDHTAFARCPNGYHKSPSGDCEKYIPHQGLPRCPNGYHRSPDGDCEKVSDSGSSSSSNNDNNDKSSSGSDSDLDSKTRSTKNDLNPTLPAPTISDGIEISGPITYVVDGDTLDVHNIRIRLALVNTPEVGEDGFYAAKNFVENLCLDKNGEVNIDDGQRQGSFGREIGVVYCDGVNLNEALMSKQFAVIDTRFCDKSEFATEDWAKSSCLFDISENNNSSISSGEVIDPSSVDQKEQAASPDCQPGSGLEHLKGQMPPTENFLCNPGLENMKNKLQHEQANGEPNDNKTSKLESNIEKKQNLLNAKFDKIREKLEKAISEEGGQEALPKDEQNLAPYYEANQTELNSQSVPVTGESIINDSQQVTNRTVPNELQQPQLVTYTDPTFNFSIQHPANWTVSPSEQVSQLENINHLVSFISPHDNALLIYVEDSTGKTIKQFAQEEYQELKGQGDKEIDSVNRDAAAFTVITKVLPLSQGVKEALIKQGESIIGSQTTIISDNKTEISTKPAWQVHYSKGGAEGSDIYVMDGDHTYVISFLGGENFSKDLPLAEKMMKTFHFAS